MTKRPRFLFENKLTILADLLMCYLVLGTIFVPIITRYFVAEMMYIFFGKGYSILPFVYSTLIAVCVYTPYLWLSSKFIKTTSNIILIYIYLILFLLGWTIYFLLNTETGWGLLIILQAKMFWPTKYAFVSNIILLVYVICRSRYPLKVTSSQKNYQKLRLGIAAVYLCLAASVPYFLSWRNIYILERDPVQVEQPLDCKIEKNILKTKKCIDNVMSKKDNSLSERWDRLIYRLKNPERKIRHIIYNNNFIDKPTKISTKFKNIKECYSEDKCTFVVHQVSGKEEMKYDNYLDNYIRIGNNINYIFYTYKEASFRSSNIYVPTGNEKFPNARSSAGHIKQYAKSKATTQKDVILSQNNGEYEIWAVGLEYFPLIDDNYFLIFSVPKFVANGTNNYNEPLFEFQKGYRFYASCHGQDCYNQNLEISLNRRDEPSVIYIRFGDNIYRIKNK